GKRRVVGASQADLLLPFRVHRPKTVPSEGDALPVWRPLRPNVVGFRCQRSLSLALDPDGDDPATRAGDLTPIRRPAERVGAHAFGDRPARTPCPRVGDTEFD